MNARAGRTIVAVARHWRPLTIAAGIALPLIVAVAIGVFAVFALRDALTFDRRITHVVWLHTHIVRLQVDQETGIRGFAFTRRSSLLEPYFSARIPLENELHDLDRLVRELRIDNGAPLVDDLIDVHRTWIQSVALPFVATIPSFGRSVALQLRSKALIDRFRDDDRRLTAAIRASSAKHTASFNFEFARILLLFLGCTVLCAAGIVAAAVQFVRLDRARTRAEMVLREREIFYENGRIWSQSFQRAVLPPRLPVVDGCLFDAVYEPGESEAQVGGDWYDAVRLVDGRILISIGDVAGSGLQAAVVMGVVRQIMRGIAQVHADPALMLDAADRALRIEYSDVFVTAWVGIVDMIERTLTFAAAGHPPVLLTDAGGSVHELRDRALPLGLRDGHQERATTVDLNDGSTMVLYTDGLTDATRDINAGEARLRAAVVALAGASWDAPAQQIKAQVLGRRSMDDVAILVAQIDFTSADRTIARVQFDLHDARAAHDARQVLSTILAERGVAESERFNAELVCGELIGNVVRHARGSREVEVAIEFGGEQTVLHVLDRGPGFRHISRLPADPLSESGRGLFLIAALTDDFSVGERFGGGSHARAVLIGSCTRRAVAPASLL